jgi:hypothetical protein
MQAPEFSPIEPAHHPGLAAAIHAGEPVATREAVWVGWPRLTHLGREPESNQGPYPEFLQLIYTGTASARDGGRDAEWTDTDGYELRSSLVTLEEARRRTSTDVLADVFLDALSSG